MAPARIDCRCEPASPTLRAPLTCFAARITDQANADDFCFPPIPSFMIVVGASVAKAAGDILAIKAQTVQVLQAPQGRIHKVKHWCGVPGTFGWKAAPVLEYCFAPLSTCCPGTGIAGRIERLYMPPIGLRITPMPSTSVSSKSPSFMNSGGVRAKPTPSGVPVEMTSPGSSVWPIERS